MQINKKVYVINGLPGSGKTTFGSISEDELKLYEVNFVHLSSIDLVKHVILGKSQHLYSEIPYHMYPVLMDIRDRLVGSNEWDGLTKDDYWRAKMAEVKKAIVDYDPNFLNDYLLEKIKNVKEPGVIFVDIREPYNIESFKNYCQENSGVSVYSILVRSDMEQLFDNPADNSVLDYTYDYEVRNDRGDSGSMDAFAKLWDITREFVRKNILEIDDSHIEDKN